MMPDRAQPERRYGKVGRTLLVNLSLIGLAAAAALFLLLGTAIRESFSRLEQRDVRGHIDRVEAFKLNTLRSLAARSKDWGIWDDAFAFANDFNATFIASNINAEAFRNAVIDGMVVIRYADRAGRAYYFDQGSGKPDPAMAKLLLALASSQSFARQAATVADFQHFVSMRGQPYALSSVRITRSDGSGPSPGYLVFAQKLEVERARLALQVPTELAIARLPKDIEIAAHSGHVHVGVPVKDPQGRSIAALNVTLPRPLMAAARDLWLMAFVAVLALLTVMLIVLSRRIRTLVLAPVERLHAHVGRIRETGELSALSAPAPANEFGALQAEFNRMTAEMQAMRTELESQSFALGTSQSAVSAMHNLRNSLSPVRVILEKLEHDAADLLPPQAARALDELADPALAPERRQKLIAFLTAAHAHVAAQERVRRQHAHEAASNLASALATIETAQQDKGEIRFDECCELAAILSHSGNVARYAEGAQVAVRLRCPDDARVSGNRVLLGQVMENLITNALEAIRESGRGDGAIGMVATVEAAARRCVVTVTDNGAGFAPDVAPRMFERGFSTRQRPSGGLGLHWCANTVRAMGGELRVESPGAGQGACATLVLPLWAGGRAAAEAA